MALLWPLLTFVFWRASRLPGEERVRALFTLGAGAAAGVLLVIIFASPTLIRGENTLSLTALFTGNQLLRYAVAAPLGALIARFSTESTGTSP